MTSLIVQMKKSFMAMCQDLVKLSAHVFREKLLQELSVNQSVYSHDLSTSALPLVPVDTHTQHQRLRETHTHTLVPTDTHTASASERDTHTHTHSISV